MSKTTAPLLSFDARGQIAKSMVYSSWKGVPYVRRYTIPSNPQTAAQTLTRSAFSWLNAVYKYAPALMVEAWDAYATGQPLTGRNGFIKLNLSNLRAAADVTALVFSPGALSGLAAASIVATPGNDQIQLVLAAPALPSGWSIDSAIFAVIEQQDPNTGILYVITSATDAATPFDQTITGLVSAVTYVCGGWFKFLRPDGKFAYGRSINTTALTT